MPIAIDISIRARKMPIQTGEICIVFQQRKLVSESKALLLDLLVRRRDVKTMQDFLILPHRDGEILRSQIVGHGRNMFNPIGSRHRIEVSLGIHIGIYDILFRRKIGNVVLAVNHAGDGFVPPNALDFFMRQKIKPMVDENGNALDPAARKGWTT